MVQELKSLKFRPACRTINKSPSVPLLATLQNNSEYDDWENAGRTNDEEQSTDKANVSTTRVRGYGEGEQYEKAIKQARELEPGSTVSIVNPRQDSWGKWLCGVVAQSLGPVNYLVRVGGGLRYVHIDQMRQRDEEALENQ